MAGAGWPPVAFDGAEADSGLEALAAGPFLRLDPDDVSLPDEEDKPPEPELPLLLLLLSLLLLVTLLPQPLLVLLDRAG